MRQNPLMASFRRRSARSARIRIGTISKLPAAVPADHSALGGSPSLNRLPPLPYLFRHANSLLVIAKKLKSNNLNNVALVLRRPSRPALPHPSSGRPIQSPSPVRRRVTDFLGTSLGEEHESIRSASGPLESVRQSDARS